MSHKINVKKISEIKFKIFVLYLLTISRILFSIIVYFILIRIDKNNNYLYLIAFFFILLVEFTDWIDGHLARRYNIVTFIGQIIDPLADSISRLIIYGTLAYKNLCPVFVPILMVLRDITIAYVKIAQISYSVDYAPRYSGKLKAFFQGLVALILILLPVLNLDNNIKQNIIKYLGYFISIVILYSLFDYIISSILKYKIKIESIK